MTARATRAGLALALLCLCCTPSCVTAALWNDRGCGNGHGWSEAAIVGRVLLTPFTLLLDGIIIGAYACSGGSGGHCR